MTNIPPCDWISHVKGMIEALRRLAVHKPTSPLPEIAAGFSTNADMLESMLNAYLELEAENARLNDQLPPSMRDCKIMFIECDKGHGRLTAKNWIEHGCDWCEITRLKAELTKERTDHAATLKRLREHGCEWEPLVGCSRVGLFGGKPGLFVGCVWLDQKAAGGKAALLAHFARTGELPRELGVRMPDVQADASLEPPDSPNSETRKA